MSDMMKDEMNAFWRLPNKEKIESSEKMKKVYEKLTNEWYLGMEAFEDEYEFWKWNEDLNKEERKPAPKPDD